MKNSNLLRKLIISIGSLFTIAQICTAMEYPSPGSPPTPPFTPKASLRSHQAQSPRLYRLRSRPYQNIIFDLFKVLLYVDKKEATRVIEEKLGCCFDPEAVMSCPTWTLLDEGRATVEDVAKDPTHKQNPEAVVWYITNIGQFILPIHVGIEIYKRIREQGYNVFILSNISVYCYQQIAYQPFFDQLSRSLRWTLPNIFEGIAGGMYSFFEGLGKSEDRDIYTRFLDTFHGPVPIEDFANSCFFIDDSPRNLKGAIAAGIATASCQTHTVTYVTCVRRGIIPPDEAIERLLDPRELEVFGPWSLEKLEDHRLIDRTLRDLHPERYV